METKINIAEILKDKPKGIRLYSPIFGECAFCSVQNITDSISVKKHNGEEELFNSKGLYCTLGEVMLFPSKEMRDWSKFTWKKGDVLMVGVDNICIFDKWNNDEYTEFDAAFVTPDYRSDVLKTKDWHNVIGENVIKIYISKIEKNKGGKLNLTTLEIEPAQPEFKDGDIVTITFNWGEDIVYIFKSENSNSYSYYAWLNGSIPTIIESSHPKSDIYTVRFSTETEKQQLFNALAKEGKAWDAEKKQIVDLKPKIELKPFDKVLVRDHNTRKWVAELFGFKSDTGRYYCVGGTWSQCIPYIGNESLLGTTKDVEE